ncbi:ATP-dependent DNA ligase [Granulicoccus phenolivorans]|uniref:ATP-dependent DNA ligase n=1 Tax=Granulicoccus phenolivorans TaxID=266854 RepID=UPI0003FA0C97|nr:ATP-dependent DNA ligase [Granulicoccus phenolivorans]
MTDLGLTEVVAVSATVSATRSRNAKVAAFAELFAAAGPADARLAAAYLAGHLPQGRIGVGWRSLAELPPAAATASWTLVEVDARISEIAAIHGAASTARRAAALTRLLERATAAEQEFLRRLMLGEMRQGAGDSLIAQGIAAAYAIDPALVQRAWMLAGDLPAVAAVAAAEGTAGLARIGLEVGRGLAPMLAGSAPDVAAAYATLDGAAASVETKIDGIRIQAHKGDFGVRLFTRSLADITDRLPEIADLVADLEAPEVVLDGEVIALRPDGRPEAFQVTGSRTAAGADPLTESARTPLTAYFFDVLALAGRTLIDEPLSVRRGALVDTVAPAQLIPHVITADVAEASAFAADAVAAGHEGVVIKRLDAVWAVGRRGGDWIKVKPRHTLDLVVLAVEWGSGRRQGLLSNIHLGARDPETGGFVMLGKTFKGMTDQMLAWQTERFTELAVARDQYTVTVRPEQVVEIAFDGLQRSTRYPGGLALRFARVLRYRDDKTADQADTIQTVRALADFTD